MCTEKSPILVEKAWEQRNKETIDIKTPLVNIQYADALKVLFIKKSQT